MATFAKRGDVWRAQVARRGVRKSGTFPTKRAAMDWARSVEAEIVGGTAVKAIPTIGTAEKGSSGLTFGSLIDRYIEEVRPVKRWGRTKDFSLAAIKARLGNVRIDDLDADRLVRFARERAAEGAGPVTVQMDLAYIGNVLKVARVVWRLPISRDLVGDAREALKLLGLVGKSRMRRRVAKPAELEAVKAAWRSDVPTSIIDFAIASCMRLSEIVALSPHDRESETILIRNRKHPTEKEGNDQLVPLLNGAPALLDAQAAKVGRYFPFPADTVGAAWQRACKRAGVIGLRFHDLRRTGITALLKQGYPVPMVMLVSGHKDFNSFRHYVGLTAADVLQYKMAAE